MTKTNQQPAYKISKGDQELSELLNNPFLKLKPIDSRKQRIEKEIYNLKFEKAYALPGSEAFKKFNIN